MVVLFLYFYTYLILFSNLYAAGSIVIDTLCGYVQNRSLWITSRTTIFIFHHHLICFSIIWIFFSQNQIGKQKKSIVAFILLISGTLGNATVLFGYVIDYVQMPFLPIVGGTIFNFADIIKWCCFTTD